MSTTEWKYVEHKCSKCGSEKIKHQVWESSDEAYEDHHYHCDGCGRDWWVEGSDY